MFKNIYICILLFIGSCNPAMAQQVQVTRDELPNTNSTDSTAVLNNVLRQNQNAINSIGGYFNSNGLLTEANGGTGVNLSTFPNGSILIQNTNNVGIGTFGQGTSGQFVTSQGVGAFPTWSTYTPPTQIANYNTTSPIQSIYEDWTPRIVLTAGAVGWRTALFGRPGTINIKFTANASGGAATGQAYVRKNGTQVGTTQNLSSVTTAFSQDFTVAAGDYFDVLFSVCTNNCNGVNFIVSAGNITPEHAVDTTGVTAITPVWKFGNGSPTTNAVTCTTGDLYSRLDGGATTTLYVCTASNTWTAK